MKKRISKKLVAPHELAAKLVELLRAAPCASDDLARITGYSGNAVRTYLSDLSEDGYVNRQAHSIPGGGRQYLWHVGAITGAMPRSRNRGGSEVRSVSQVHQKIVTRFEAFHYRDPLVSALFGPASRAAV